MTDEILIYGAYGYTGQLIARRASEMGLKAVLAGRDELRTRRLAEELGLKWTSFALNDTGAIDTSLHDKRILLNCAGPFSKTARQLMEACIRKRRIIWI